MKGGIDHRWYRVGLEDGFKGYIVRDLLIKSSIRSYMKGYKDGVKMYKKTLVLS